MKCVYQETDQLYLKLLVSYLDNPFEEAISESSKIKEQNETIKHNMLPENTFKALRMN